MNSLSWMIYAADVVGSANVAAGVVAVGGIIAGVVATIGFTAAKTCIVESRYSFETPEVIAEKRAKLAENAGFHFRFLRHAVTAFAVGVVMLTITPGRETVYAIAASEMGEQVIKSPTAGKAMKALDAWLDRQIAEPAK